MSQSLINVNNKVIAALSTASNQTSGVLNISSERGYCIQTTFTGSPSGSLTICGSIDGINFPAVNTTAISTSGSNIFNTDGIHYPFVEINWTGSGTGTITSTIVTKQF